MRRLSILLVCLFLVSSLVGCKKFLNVTPDKTGSLEDVFTQRSKAQKFLYGIYSYLPSFGRTGDVPGYLAGGAILTNSIFKSPASRIARGEQRVVRPLLDFWNGGRGGKNLYQAIRKCNVFLNRIDNVGNMTEIEKQQWKGEVKVLQAYFNFYLIRMYGPIVLRKNVVPINAPESKIKVPRSPVDSCFSYVVHLLNQAIHNPGLPARVANKQENLGRMTKTIAYALKAQVEITAASPLFNGNKDYEGFENVNGINPFNTKYDPTKWDSAAVAAKEAIDYAEAHNYHLYNYKGSGTLSDTTIQKMTIRNSFARGAGKDRPNVIWGGAGGSFRSKLLQCRMVSTLIIL